MLCEISVATIFIIYWFIAPCLDIKDAENFQDILANILFSCFIYGIIFCFVCICGIASPNIIPKVYRAKFIEINHKIQDKIDEIW